MSRYPSTINDNSLADIEFKINWTSPEGSHTDTSLVMVNFWRDLLPEAVIDELMGAQEGDTKTFRFGPGQLAPDYDEASQYRIRRADFNEALAKPSYGRFYPKGILKNLPNVFPQNITPTRCIGIDADTVTMDMNHPLAGRDMELTAVVRKIYDKPFDRGGNCRELGESIAVDGAV